jgi:hypothetical protein
MASLSRWSQTVNEVVIEVDVEPGTRGKEAQVTIKPSHLECIVKGNLIFQVTLAWVSAGETPMKT